MLLTHMRGKRDEVKALQTDVALRTGYTQAYVSMVENGRRNVDQSVAERFARALNCDVDDLVTVEDVPVAAWLR
jgi:transcriptional regulator with XRE-family HTH domain